MTALTLLLLSAASAFAEGGAADLGTSAAPFLTLGAGARAAALGEAVAALADDATALYWNPAGLAALRRRSVVLSHASTLDSNRLEQAFFAQPLGAWGGMGAGVHYLWAPELTETDATGVELGRFRPNDLAATLGYGIAAQGWSVGAAVKVIRSQVIASDATGAVDFGVLSPWLWDKRLRLGFSVLNMGGELNYGTESFGLPLRAKAGLALRPAAPWLWTLDTTIPKDGEPFAATGFEYLWPTAREVTLALRAGFNSQTVGHVSGFALPSFGFGVSMSRLSFDYAVVPYGSLGLAHQFSLGATW